MVWRRSWGKFDFFSGLWTVWPTCNWDGRTWWHPVAVPLTFVLRWRDRLREKHIGWRVDEGNQFASSTGSYLPYANQIQIKNTDSKTPLEHLTTPVMGSATGTRPTSGDVHLFADPSTYYDRRPCFYADCEGFGGGNDPPSTSLNPQPAATIWATRRNIQWASVDQRTRQWMVENLYPRIIFTFSDTICFVTKNIRWVWNPPTSDIMC